MYMSIISRKAQKIVLLGNTYVGKTSIATRFRKLNFNSLTDCTIGASFMKIIRGKKAFDLWDTAGQERYLSLTSFYYKDASIILLVFDVSDKKSLNRIKYYIDQIRLTNNKDYKIIFIGNKMDLIEHDEFEIKKIKQSLQDIIIEYDINNCTTLYISAKDNDGIENLLDLIFESCTEPKSDESIIDLTQPTNNIYNKINGCKC